MTDLSWIYCCIHDVHPTLECCLEWEIMENVLNFDQKGLHIIRNIWINWVKQESLLCSHAQSTELWLLLCVAFSASLGYESSQGGDRTLYSRMLTEQTFISTALKAMQPSFWQKRSLFAPEFLLRWTQLSETEKLALRIMKLVEAATALAHQVFLCHLENHSKISSVPLFPFLCMTSQLQGESKLQDISLLHHPQRWVRNWQKVKPIWKGAGCWDKQHLPPEEEPGSQSQHYQNWL